MTKQTIEVGGLPEGWKSVDYRCAIKGEFVLIRNKAIQATHDHTEDSLIIEKIQPRRIVLDLTQHEYSLLLKIPIEQRLFDDPVMFDLLRKIQTAEVNKTDIPFTNDEPKLSLSVDECKGLFEGNQPTINKVKRFIKENS